MDCLLCLEETFSLLVSAEAVMSRRSALITAPVQWVSWKTLPADYCFTKLHIGNFFLTSLSRVLRQLHLWLYLPITVFTMPPMQPIPDPAVLSSWKLEDWMEWNGCWLMPSLFFTSRVKVRLGWKWFREKYSSGTNHEVKWGWEDQ